jgi:hypothetical protein
MPPLWERAASRPESRRRVGNFAANMAGFPQLCDVHDHHESLWIDAAASKSPTHGLIAHASFAADLATSRDPS